MMGRIFWPILANTINKFLKNGDLAGLRKFIIDNDLKDNYKVSGIIAKYTGLGTNDFFRYFDEDGKCTGDKYLLLRELWHLDYYFKVDSSTREYFTDEEIHFLNYCKIVFKSGNGDNFYYNTVVRCHEELFSDLPKYFDGTKPTKEFYDFLLRVGGWNLDDAPKEIRNRYPRYAVELATFINKHKDNDDIPEKYENIFRFVSRYLMHVNYNHYDKIKIIRKGTKQYLDIEIDKSILDDMFFNYITIEAFLKCEEYNHKEILSRYYSELQMKVFFSNDYYLKDYFLDNKISCNDIDNYFYLEGDRLLLKKDIFSYYLKDKKYIEAFEIISNFYDLNTIKNYNVEGFNIDSLILLSRMYSNIKKLDESSLALEYFYNNLDGPNSWLNMSVDQLTRLEKVLLEICKRIYESNAPELRSFGGDILYQIIMNNNDYDYMKALDRIEVIFTTSNLPDVGKKFLIYQILHPNFEEEDLSDNKIISPTLKNISKNRRFDLLFSDLMRITLGCNNLSIKHYFENLYYGNALYISIAEGKISLDTLSEYDKEILTEFLNHLCSLYNNTLEGKKNNFVLTGNLLDDLNNLIPLFKPSDNYSLLDRIIRMYGILAGFKSFQEAFDYMNSRIEEANKRGIDNANKPLILEKGDMIKGIGKIDFLYDILQNGSLCKEFLGPNMSSDMTPLDTDLSLVKNKKLTVSSTMKDMTCNNYGPIWFVIKKDKFPVTRVKPDSDDKSIVRGPECFSTLDDDHMGIRTGFATSDIDYIIVDKKEVDINEVCFLVALNGIYIPIIDKSTGKNIFKVENYLDIRSKMSGLSYYDLRDYKISNNLKVPNDYDNKALIEDAKNKKKHINNFMRDLMKKEFNYSYRSRLSSDISIGSVQLIDTGSTGRGTNVNNDSDFDFIMRVDEKADREKIGRVICSNLGIDYEEAKRNDMVIGGGNLRLKDVKIPGLDTLIDMDITFLSKSDKVVYTTDMAISDRLNTIKKLYPDKYEDVLDNIIYAKQFMKANNVYKPAHNRETPQGGLGGVGIENWILQNGGSFYDACLSFYNAATINGRVISFDEFKKRYRVYDFGENFYNGEHDEFVSNNMTDAGYKKMYKAVCVYLNHAKKDVINIEEEPSMNF